METTLTSGREAAPQPEKLAWARKVLKTTLRQPEGPGPQVTDLQRVEALKALVSGNVLENYAPLLPLLFNLNGQPYQLDDHFPFEPLYNRHLSESLVVKSGRQLAKCGYLADDVVRLADGRQVPVSMLSAGDEVLSLVQDRFVPRRVREIFRTGVKPVLRILTRTGCELRVTAEHRLRTLTGYVPAGELKRGSRLAGVRRGGEFGSLVVPRERIILTAYMLGDGCCRGRAWSFSAAVGPVLTEFRTLADGLEAQGLTSHVRSADNYSLRLHSDNKLVAWLREDGYADQYSWEKRLPAWAFALDRADTVLFLSRLWATDGMVKERHGSAEISYCSTSRAMARDVRSLLNKFGIPASICRKKSGYRKGGVYKACRDAFVVRVETREGLRVFLRTFSVPGKPSFELADVPDNSNRDTVPLEVRDWLAELAEDTAYKHRFSLKSRGLRLRPKYPLSRRKLRSYVAYFERVAPEHPRLADLRGLLYGDVWWDEVVSVAPDGECETCDLEVEGEDHNYVLDGVVSHNSTNQASRLLLLANTLPYFTALVVTPLYEQVRKFSTEYVAKFIDESPLKHFWSGTSTVNSVLHRSFKNFSKVYFSFAGTSADRIRGISAQMVAFDEVQDLDPNHLPVIKETMSHSRYGTGLAVYTGTPKALDNTLEWEWQRSSQAEWMIPCANCRKENYPCLALDLDRMIGPLHDDIGPVSPRPDQLKKKIRPGVPAVVCARCGHWLEPRVGRWVHKVPQLRWDYPGYHVPQIIMPIHCEGHKRWAKLLAKRGGAENYTQARFYNEVLGESYDVGAKLITITDLNFASTLPWRNDTRDWSIQRAVCDRYVMRILGVDWGGGGEDEVSWTTAAVVGVLADGHMDVIYGERLLTPNDPIPEARRLLQIYNAFQCQFFAHDYNGAGNLREAFMVQAGLPVDRVVPFVYNRTANKDMVVFHKSGDGHNSRNYWWLDKARSLELVCEMIKLCRIRFFQPDFVDVDNRGLVRDFLSLVVHKVETAAAGETFNIHRVAAFPDDFAHSVNFACCAAWHNLQSWPQVAHIANLMLTMEQQEALNPPNPWCSPQDVDEYFLIP